MKIKIKIPDIEYWEPVSGWLHVVGAVASLFGLVVLNYLSAKHGTYQHFWSNAVFMVSMLLLYTASAIYHVIPYREEMKQIFRRIDHAMIFVLIAGTYTPLCVIALRDHSGHTLLALMWFIAIIGICLKLFKVNVLPNIQTGIYLGMGWIGILEVKVLFQIFGPSGFWWFLGGGIAYTLGAICFIAEDRYDPESTGWYHEIFHIFVMIGSFCHYWLMQEYLMRI